MDKNFGKSAEKSPKYLFSVSLEKKNAWKIRLPEKSGLSALFWRKIGNFRFIGGKIGREQHALEGALTEGEIAVFSARS